LPNSKGDILFKALLAQEVPLTAACLRGRTALLRGAREGESLKVRDRRPSETACIGKAGRSRRTRGPKLPERHRGHRPPCSVKREPVECLRESREESGSGRRLNKSMPRVRPGSATRVSRLPPAGHVGGPGHSRRPSPRVWSSSWILYAGSFGWSATASEPAGPLGRIHAILGPIGFGDPGVGAE
jgi:hypothetical protein